MSGIVIMILVIAVIVFVAFTAIKMYAEKKAEGQDKSNTANVKDLQVDAVEVKRKAETIYENPELIAAKKELYQYLSQVIKKMFLHYRRGTWDAFTRVNIPSDAVMKQYDQIKQSLTPPSAQILDDFFACIVLEENEEKKVGDICNPGLLKEVFLRMVLPFYPVYFDQLDGIRHTALLNQTVLNLFHRLTGKKFRLGYKNRYASGVIAYRWSGDKYQVYAQDGTLLCDAVFRNGRVWDGYARVPLEGEDAKDDWVMVQAGTFQEGAFKDGRLQYIYRKKCGQI